MPRTQAQYIGIEKILDAFDKYEGKYFAIMKSKDVVFHCQTDDAREKLESWLRDGYEAENNAEYAIRLFDKKTKDGIYDAKDQPRMILYCQICPYEPAPRQQYLGATGTDPNILRLLEKQQETLNMLASKVAAMESEDDDEDDDDEPEQSGIGSAIGNMLNNPAIQERLIMGLIGGFSQQAPKAMAGIHTATLDEALDILKNNGVTDDDLMKLAEMSVNNPTQFNWLLKMLRQG